MQMLERYEGAGHNKDWDVLYRLRQVEIGGINDPEIKMAHRSG